VTAVPGTLTRFSNLLHVRLTASRTRVVVPVRNESMEMPVFAVAIGFVRACSAAESHCKTNHARIDPGRTCRTQASEKWKARSLQKMDSNQRLLVRYLWTLLAVAPRLQTRQGACTAQRREGESGQHEEAVQIGGSRHLGRGEDDWTATLVGEGSWGELRARK
jgi:hypothetical protein